jgi:clan AA aspartic protease
LIRINNYFFDFNDFFESESGKLLFLSHKLYFMGFVYDEVKLINAEDFGMARRCMLDQDDVRQINVSVLVDSGAWMLTINENIQSYLQLPFERTDTGVTADGRRIECDVVGPVRVEWQNRGCYCSAMVLPGDSEPLLGAIPMEDMDLAILPKEGKLVGKHHPDYPVHRI